MAILSMIPKKVWIYTLVAFAGAMIVLTAFDKGSEYGKNKCLVASQKASDKALEESLANLQAVLEKAVTKQREGLKAVEALKSQYSSVERDKEQLQKALDDALTNPPDCNKLDPRYYELYKSRYNKPAP